MVAVVLCHHANRHDLKRGRCYSRGWQGHILGKEDRRPESLLQLLILVPVQSIHSDPGEGKARDRSLLSTETVHWPTGELLSQSNSSTGLFLGKANLKLDEDLPHTIIQASASMFTKAVTSLSLACLTATPDPLSASGAA